LRAFLKIFEEVKNGLPELNQARTYLEKYEAKLAESMSDDEMALSYVKSLLGALKFSGEDTEKKIRVLSGGEKSRVVLVTIFAKPVNFLILDEPTNHLNNTLREVLLRAIKNFDGTVMVVSYDRHFLRQITTKVFELDCNRLIVTEGSLDYYLEKARVRSDR